MPATTAAVTQSIKYGTPVKAVDRQFQGADALSKQYGNIDYDRDAIESVFQKGVDAEYAAKKAEYARSANQYYNRLGSSQNAYLDAMRKSRAGAVETGASSGIQSSNALSAMLGMSQQTSLDNTTLAQGQRALADQEGAARAKAVNDAMQYANQQKLALGTLDTNQGAVNAQKYVGELGANAQVATANTAASAQGYTADQQKAASDYSSNMNYKGVDLSSGRQLEGTRYSSDKGLEGQKVYAGGMVQSANVNANAARYAANQNLNASRYESDNATNRTTQTNVTSIVNTAIANKQFSQDPLSFLNTLYGTGKEPAK
jgi:hypothetical protein